MALLAGALISVSCASLRPPDFVEIEHRWVDALQKHDTATLNQLLDDSFVDSTFRGEIRKKNDVLAGPPAGGPYRSIRLDDLAVRQYGSHTAIVTGINVLQGASETDVVRIRFTDVFVQKHGQWRAVSAQETLQTAPKTS